VHLDREKLGQRPNEEETILALKRLRNRGFVRLVKYTARYNSWYDYATGQSVAERWFFHLDSFWVMITELGRAHRDEHGTTARHM
jgi:hypothetical protein